ncbi:unnamed protein product [Symbiodinium sp. CCMP2592]|nr:unnamed protein product [Symbiodinium sp. CCMP2592]
MPNLADLVHGVNVDVATCSKFQADWAVLDGIHGGMNVLPSPRRRIVGKRRAPTEPLRGEDASCFPLRSLVINLDRRRDRLEGAEVLKKCEYE